jgi:uncharacterized damage-inducible protein DinB
MKRKLIVIVPAALACAALFAQQKGGAPVDMATDLKQNYNGGKSKIIAAAEQMAEENYSFKPNPDEMSFGGWVAHVADLQSGFCNSVTGGTKTVGAGQKTAKADLVAALKESFEICDAAYDGTTAANINDNVQTFRGPRPRGSWLWFNVAHNEECYGSMSVYLRIKNIVPPSTAARQKGKGK